MFGMVTTFIVATRSEVVRRLRDGAAVTHETEKFENRRCLASAILMQRR